MLCQHYLQRHPADDQILTLAEELRSPAPIAEQLSVDAPALLDTADHAASLNQRGEAAFREGDVARAERAFNQAYELDRENVDVCNNLAVLHWQTGNVEAALRYLAEALEQDPKNRDVVINGGQILVALEQTREAQGLYTAYLETSPDDAEVARLLRSIGDKADQHSHSHDLKVSNNEAASPAVSLSKSATPVTALRLKT